MKIPEPVFKVINLIVRLLLNSPVHSFWSDNLLVIGFTGRKSGKSYQTPVRYIVHQGVIQVFTSRSGPWWRNIADNPNVTALVKGQRGTYKAVVTTDDLQKVSEALTHCLDQFPQDAVYHDISLNADGAPDANEFEAALPNVVLIELTAGSGS